MLDFYPRYYTLETTLSILYPQHYTLDTTPSTLVRAHTFGLDAGGGMTDWLTGWLSGDEEGGGKEKGEVVATERNLGIERNGRGKEKC